MRRRIAGMFFSLATIPFALISATTQETRVVSSPSIPPEVPDSLAGLQTQVDELVRAAKTRDQGNWQIALETFSLPNPGFWFQKNFAPEHLAQLTRDYTKAREGHFALMSSVIAHHQDALNFRIQVTPSQMPAPPSSKGPESQHPLPSHPLACPKLSLNGGRRFRIDAALVGLLFCIRGWAFPRRGRHLSLLG